MDASTPKKAPRTVTREDLRNALRGRLPTLSPEEAKNLVDETFEEIASGLNSDGKVQLSGFGAFIIHHKKERRGRNPKSGVEATITARRSVSFKPSNKMKDGINSSSLRCKKTNDPETWFNRQQLRHNFCDFISLGATTLT